MTSALSEIRLLQTSDSAFPSGNFAFSNGLETLVAEGRVSGAAEITGLLRDQILPRWQDFDRWFLCEAFGAAGSLEALQRLDQECHCQSTTESLAAAARRVGRALLRVHDRLGTPGASAFYDAIGRREGGETSGYEPVVQGLIGAGLGLSRRHVEIGAVHTLLSAAVSAAVRLGRLGALEAQSVLADIAEDAAHALDRPLPALPHTFAPLAEIAAQRRNAGASSLFAT